jgi:hypothetical protein
MSCSIIESTIITLEIDKLDLKPYLPMDETLGKEYEEWLDSIEATLPLPVPEGESYGNDSSDMGTFTVT